MTMQPDSVTPNVGQRIRDLREGQGLSLRALAKASGLSLNAISLIERGENSPTVSSLHALATALGVSIVDFFQTRPEQAVVYTQPNQRLSSEANGILIASLGSGLQYQQMAPFVLTIAPGAGEAHQPITHAGEEFVFCVAGEVQYRVGETVYPLTPGCSLLFKASLPHCFFNDTAVDAQLLLVFLAEEDSYLARQLHSGHTPLAP
ncbi:MAG: cupin domain-containing protein [Anaerolineales bacterium]|nr:cupin domain-containing protein [Anaerolineales bacterium]